MVERSFGSKSWLGEYSDTMYTKLDVVSIEAIVTLRDLRRLVLHCLWHGR